MTGLSVLAQNLERYGFNVTHDETSVRVIKRPRLTDEQMASLSLYPERYRTRLSNKCASSASWEGADEALDTGDVTSNA